jgi:cytochrome c
MRLMLTVLVQAPAAAISVTMLALIFIWPSHADPGSGSVRNRRADELMVKYRCFECHRGDEPLIGPPFAAVAERYRHPDAAQTTELARKIIKGGYGKWGVVPMVPTPDMSNEEADVIVKYVLANQWKSSGTKADQQGSR